jgi:hypothetical protein
MHLGHCPDECQPDAEASQRALERCIHLREHVKYVLQLIGGDADARIAHTDDDLWGGSH